MVAFPLFCTQRSVPHLMRFFRIRFKKEGSSFNCLHYVYLYRLTKIFKGRSYLLNVKFSPSPDLGMIFRIHSQQDDLQEQLFIAQSTRFRTELNRWLLSTEPFVCIHFIASSHCPKKPYISHGIFTASFTSSRASCINKIPLACRTVIWQV